MTACDVDPGKPLGTWKRAWSRAKKPAGVECRIHDLRLHFALAQRQIPATITPSAGHLSRKMPERYSHVSPGGEVASCGVVIRTIHTISIRFGRALSIRNRESM
jgi:hypothetical protein